MSVLENNNPLISVLTPSWNRSAFLPIVWQHLNSQSFLNFEWIVANDGSSDDTIKVVESLARKSSFPIILINANKRIGKSRMDNEGIKASRGKFIVWCDSDDYLHSNALEELLATWNSIPEVERNYFCGVTALSETNTGILGKTYPKSGYTDICLNKLLNIMKSDLVIFTNAYILKKHLFKEVDFLIPESSVWNAIGNKKTRFIPKVLKRSNYNQVNCISHSGFMSFNRGRAHALAISKPYQVELLSTKEKIWRAIIFLRYSYHGDIKFKDAISLWRGNIFDRAQLYLLLPFALLFIIKDIAKKVVIKTHIEFESSNSTVSITKKQLC